MLNEQQDSIELQNYLDKIIRFDVDVYRQMVQSPVEITLPKAISVYNLLTVKLNAAPKKNFYNVNNGIKEGISELFKQFVADVEIGKSPYILRVGDVDFVCSEMYFRCLRAIFLIGTETNPGQAAACRKIGETLLKYKLKKLPEEKAVQALKDYKDDNYYYQKLTSDIMKLMSPKK